jgi:hypothetical protein
MCLDPSRLEDDRAHSRHACAPRGHDGASTFDVCGQSFDVGASGCFVCRPASHDRGQCWDRSWSDPRTSRGPFARFPTTLRGRRVPLRRLRTNERRLCPPVPGSAGKCARSTRNRRSIVCHPRKGSVPSSWVGAPSSGVDAPTSEGCAPASWVGPLTHHGWWANERRLRVTHAWGAHHRATGARYRRRWGRLTREGDRPTSDGPSQSSKGGAIPGSGSTQPLKLRRAWGGRRPPSRAGTRRMCRRCLDAPDRHRPCGRGGSRTRRIPPQGRDGPRKAGARKPHTGFGTAPRACGARAKSQPFREDRPRSACIGTGGPRSRAPTLRGLGARRWARSRWPGPGSTRRAGSAAECTTEPLHTIARENLGFVRLEDGGG